MRTTTNDRAECCFRQGDVVLKQIRALPTGAHAETCKPLAVGEVTGHSHQFVPGANVQLWQKAGVRFVEVRSSARLLHEEHGDLIIPHGIYEQLQEREYDYAEEARLPVSD